MRLLSAQVKNYRVHEDVSVKFHPQSSLIAGLNEAGKSTLVEAIHRAFFVPAKGNTAVHKGMRRHDSIHYPEVTVEFEHANKNYRLYKHFGGTTKYDAQLFCNNQRIASDTEVDDQLADITGSALEGSPRKDEVVNQQWGHLWVWQGASGTEPSEFINDTSEDLIKRFESLGVASVTMSNRDSQLATRFRQNFDETFTATGKVSTKSELGQCENKLTACDESLAKAQETVNQLESDAKQFQTALTELERLGPQLSAQREELNEVSRKIAAAEGVTHAVEAARQNFNHLTASATRLRENQKLLLGYDERIEQLKAALKEDNSAEVLSLRTEKASQILAESEAQLDAVRLKLTDLSTRQQVAAAQRTRIEAISGIARAQARVDELLALRKSVRQQRDQLAGLPEVAEETITELEQLKNEIFKLTHKLETSEAKLTVTTSADALQVNGMSPRVGETVSLGLTTVVRCGEAEFTIEIPGVSDVLALRREKDDLQQQFERVLTQHIIDQRPAASILELREARGNRQVLAKAVETDQKRLTQAEKAKPEEELASAKQNLQDSTARERAHALADWTSTDDAQEALLACQLIDAQLAQQQREVASADAAVKSAKTQLQALQLELEQAKADRRSTEDTLTGQVSNRKALLDAYEGKPEALLAALHQAEEEEIKAKRELQRRQAELDALQVDQLRISQERLSKALQTKEQIQQSHLRTRDEARGRLKPSDEAEDPFELLNQAKEQQQRVSAEYARLRAEAEADKLLHELFAAETAAANERLTTPLAEKIGDYVRHLFGHTASVALQYDAKKGFDDFYLVRPSFADEPELFTSLSGGAREQVAAAVRLATAELLAGAHGGTLPIIFDDAFTNTDHERVKGILNMLYYASKQGLQIIVSSCHHALYEGMGGRQVELVRGQSSRLIAEG